MTRQEHGFTLIEALASILILMFGLLAVAQLWSVAAMSNDTANRASVTTAAASQALEQLMSQHFAALADGETETWVTGAGRVVTTWQITPLDATMVSIRVTSTIPGVFQALSRSEFVTYRTRVGVPDLPGGFVTGPSPSSGSGGRN